MTPANPDRAPGVTVEARRRLVRSLGPLRQAQRDSGALAAKFDHEEHRILLARQNLATVPGADLVSIEKQTQEALEALRTERARHRAALKRCREAEGQLVEVLSDGADPRVGEILGLLGEAQILARWSGDRQMARRIGRDLDLVGDWALLPELSETCVAETLKAVREWVDAYRGRVLDEDLDGGG